MTDFAPLDLVVDSTDVGQAKRELAGLTAAGARAEAQTDRLSRSSRILATEARGASSAARLLAAGLASVSLVATADKVADLADGYTAYTNSLKVAGLEGSNLSRTQDALFQSAQRAGAPLQALGTLYGRAASSAKDLGASQSELLTFTDLVATSLKVSGRSATESSGALLQLSQALGGSKIQAEEYNSLIDGLRPLLISVASGSDKWGGSVSKLTQDVKAGKVTTEQFFDSALRGKKVLDDMASKTVPTLAQSFTRLDNAVGRFIGQANEGYAVTARISMGIDAVAENLDKIVPVLGVAAAYVGVRWAAAGAQFVSTEVARVAALGASINAERAAAISTAQLAASRASSAVADLTAQQAGIVTARQAVTARIAAANATIAANAGVVASTYEVALAERARAAGLADLVALGRAQTAVNAQLAVSAQAAAVAEAELAAASRVATASMTGFRAAGAGLLALLGGPWGIALTAAAGGAYLLYQALGQAERENTRLKESLGGAKNALDEYEKAALDAAGQTGKAAEKSKLHAEELRKEAEAAVMAARALREKALAEAEAADRNVSQTQATRQSRVDASLFSADPIASALAATVPEALAEQRQTNAKSRAKIATEAAAAAEARYEQILKSSTVASSGSAAAADKQAKAKRGAKETADDFIKALRQEIEETGRTEKEVRGLEIARARADAPLKSQKVLIAQLGEQREAAIAAASAWDTLAKLKAANDDRTLSPVQRTRRDNQVALNDVADFEGGAQSAAGAALRLAAEVEERWAQALDAVRGDIKLTADTIGEAFGGDAGLFNLERDLDALQILEQQATQAAQNIAEAFGQTGNVIGAALTAFSNYRSTQAALDVQIAKGEKTQAQASQELRTARVRGYGDMARAAKGYFSESSAGYKLLQTAEIAFRTVETLNTIQAMALDSAHTVSSVANSGARASADGVAAYAKTLASLPFPFNLAAGATVLAALAGVGVAIAGGGGKGGSVTNVAQDRQDALGTGTVLGDKSAKSESIARALELASRNQNKDLEFSSQMVRSLRSIDSNIGSLTAALARQLAVAGFLNGSSAATGSSFNRSGLGDAISATLPLIGGFIGGLFGTKTKTTLQDSGISFADQSIADILAGGIQGQAYQQTQTTKKKKFFGVTTSNKTSTSTAYSDLDAGLEGEFTRVIASLRDGVIAAAGVLGVEGAQATIDALKLAIGPISLKDLKGDELEAALQAAFGKAADQMASAVLPAVEKFQQVGEGAFETITRLARDYQVVDIAMLSIGKTFGLVGVQSIEARERLIDLAGGLDELQSATDFFAENFLTEAERLAPVQKAVNDELKRLGLESLKTRDQFKDVVLGIDVTTAAGAELYASLLSLAPAFAKVTEAADDALQAAIDAADRKIDDARSNVDSIRSALKDAFQRESSALNQQIEAMRGVARSMQDANAKLAGQGLSGAVQTDAARYAFQAAAAGVRANPTDRDAYSRLQSAGEALVTASKASSSTVLDFNRDLAAVLQEQEAAGLIATQQADTAERQLAQLTDLVAGQLGAVNEQKTTNVLLTELLAAEKALSAALNERQALTPPSNDNLDLKRYQDSNPDLKANWDEGGIMRTLGATFEEALRAQYAGWGKDEISKGLRTYATGGMHPGGLRLVGEEGPELEVTGPSRIYSAADTAQMLGGNNADLIAELRALRAEVAALRAEQRSQLAEGNKHNKQTARVLTNVTRDGDRMQTTTKTEDLAA